MHASGGPVAATAADHLAKLEQSVETVDTLTEAIRQKRVDERRFSEGLRVLRQLITRRESAAFYEHLPGLRPWANSGSRSASCARR